MPIFSPLLNMTIGHKMCSASLIHSTSLFHSSCSCLMTEWLRRATQTSQKGQMSRTHQGWPLGRCPLRRRPQYFGSLRWTCWSWSGWAVCCWLGYGWQRTGLSLHFYAETTNIGRYLTRERQCDLWIFRHFDAVLLAWKKPFGHWTPSADCFIDIQFCKLWPPTQCLQL